MLPKINGLFRLTRDAELKFGANGNPILNMGLASSEKYKDNETPCFLDAVVFSKPAEIIAQYAGSKGTQIYLTGKLKTEQWADKQTGQNRSKLVMIVEGFDFVSGQNKGQQQSQQPQQNVPQNAPQQSYPVGHNAPNDFDDCDVPFSRKATSPELFTLI